MNFILKTEKRLRRQKFAGLLYLILVIFIGFMAASRGLSYYYADLSKVLRSQEEISTALEFDSSNPEIYKIGGLIQLKSDDFSSAVETLEKAVKLRKNDYLLWQRLGYARYKLGDWAGARLAYQKSLELAPDYAMPHRFMGRLLLKSGETETAFYHLARAAELSPELSREVLHLARKRFSGDGELIERIIASENPEIRKLTAFYFIKHSIMTEKMKNFLTGDFLSEAEKNEYIRALIKKEEFFLAREIWASQKNHKLLFNQPDGEMMLDGGFEQTTENDEIGFGWQINQRISDISTAIDGSEKETGNRSVQIVFKGKTEINARILSQMVTLEAGQVYNLSFSAFLPEIVSGGGLGVAAFDAADEKVLGESPVIKSSAEKWNRYQFDFRAPDSSAVVIALRRLPCRMSPCPVFADLRLDNFSLKKAAH